MSQSINAHLHHQRDSSSPGWEITIARRSEFMKLASQLTSFPALVKATVRSNPLGNPIFLSYGATRIRANLHRGNNGQYWISAEGWTDSSGTNAACRFVTSFVHAKRMTVPGYFPITLQPGTPIPTFVL